MTRIPARPIAPILGLVALATGVIPAALPDLVPAARGESLEVTVVDSRDRHPIEGAFVMVGPGKGIPFSGNTATTPASGTVVFQNPGLAGPQTVTAGIAGYAYFTVTDAVVGAVTLPLYPAVADTEIYGPKARVTGTVTGIATTNNDSKFDLALILPAISVDQFLGAGSVAFEVPPDIADFPIVGQIPFPGNLVMPSQIEFYVLNFSKPDYKIDLPAQTTQTLYSISFRIPVDFILNPPPNADPLKVAEIRELGVERNKAVGNGLNQNINSDHNLRTELTVRIDGAPLGSLVSAVSLGSLPGPNGEETIIGYDTDYALVDTLDTFLIASSVPAGDIADVSNIVAGLYADTSAFLAYTSGRLDRTPFTLPANRVIGDFYDPPALTEVGAEFRWSDVASGNEPAPTWVLSSFTLGPIAPPDSTVDTLLVWRVASPASTGGFVLPSLPAEAPGPPSGLPDVDQTPQADRLIWDCYIANPEGTLDEVLVHPSRGATHFSRRAQTLALEPAGLSDARRSARGGIGLSPNPASGEVTIRLDARPRAESVRLEIVDPSGRRVRSLDLGPGAREALWDGRDERGRTVPPGTYFVREAGGSGAPAVKVQLLR